LNNIFLYNTIIIIPFPDTHLMRKTSKSAKVHVVLEKDARNK